MYTQRLWFHMFKQDGLNVKKKWLFKAFIYCEWLADISDLKTSIFASKYEEKENQYNKTGEWNPQYSYWKQREDTKS